MAKPLELVDHALRYADRAIARLRGEHPKELEYEESPEFNALIALIDATDALIRTKKALEGRRDANLQLENEVAGDP